MFQNS
jgi:integrase